MLDVDAFVAELDAIRAELIEGAGPEDIAHLDKIARWGRLCGVVGYGTAWLGPNVLSAFLISQSRTARWATVAHHVCHNGYRNAEGASKQHHPGVFARGKRRLVDWMDVLAPEAWSREHNDLHHFRLGETADPDQVQQNLERLRESDLPLAAKYAIVFAMASTWKWIYYAPLTVASLHEVPSILDRELWDPTTDAGRMLWFKCLLPYFLWIYVAIPAMFGLLGPIASFNVAVNSAIAEWFANLQTFGIIVPNHAGDDIPLFEGKPADRSEFLLRQIRGSVNYRTGGDLNDFLHGWLNYQIEHHLWPDMTMLQYQRAQPRVKALCEKYGVPYLQHSVLHRIRKTVAVMVGTETMVCAPV